jgi:nicotinate-nucleotide adenylyltransferase
VIGIFGGTFDPVHYGHLRPLLEVREALHLDEVRLIPCYIPPHRGTPGATPAQRLAMLQLAVDEIPGFVIDERELQRGGPSYMVDTLQSLRDEVGSAPLIFILGMDAFNKLDTWHEWSRLIELAHIVVMLRPGSAMPNGAVAELVSEHRVQAVSELQKTAAGGLWFQPVTQLEIAATAIRERVAQGRDIRFLVPETVRKYIEVNGLYPLQKQ